MLLALQILDGPHKGQRLALRKDYVFSGDFFNDQEMGKKHASVYVDQSFSWNISSLDSNKIRIGLSESDKISLIPGLIFHLGQTGFKVVEPSSIFQDQNEDWEQLVVAWLQEQSWGEVSTEFFFFLNPVRLNFLQGPQADEFYTLSYGPRLMGHNQIDLNLTDPSLPSQLVRFYQIGETAYIENLAGEKVLLNKNNFDHHAIAEGDLLQFGHNIISLSILR